MPEAWEQPATPDDYKQAIATLVAAVEPDAKNAPKRVQVLKRLMQRRGYSRAELLLVMEELPFRNDYGKGIRLDLVEEIVQQHRKDRKMLQRALTAEEMHALIERHPDDLHRENFQVTAHNSRNEKLYRYMEELTGPTCTEIGLLEGEKELYETTSECGVEDYESFDDMLGATYDRLMLGGPKRKEVDEWTEYDIDSACEHLTNQEKQALRTYINDHPDGQKRRDGINRILRQAFQRAESADN